jgi:hypothetical protein
VKPQARESPPFRPLVPRRVRWLHHYQAWSPKLRRRISLFARPSLSLWILLEANPDVEQFCERPGHILIDGERRLADFWIKRTAQSEYLVLPDIPTLSLLDDPGGLLDPLPVRTITPDWLAERAQQIANWTRILPIITSHTPFLSGVLLDQVLDRLRRPERLVDIERSLLPEDPMRTRAVVLELLRCGHLVADELASQPLSGATRFTRVG